MNNSTITGDAQTEALLLGQYISVRYIIFQIIIPLIAMVGIVGNSFSLLILAENKAKYAFATYLKALTLADTCFLIGLLSRCAISIFGKFMSSQELNKIEVYGDLLFGRSAGHYLHQLNSGFVTVISFERFVAVVFPLKVKQFVIDRHPVRVIIAIMVFHVTIMLPMLLFVEVRSTVSQYTNVTSYYIGYTEFGMVILEYYFIFATLVKYIIPMVIVVITATAVVISLRLRSFNEDTQGKKWCMERSRMTIVLIVIATFFTCNSLLTLTLSIIVILFPELTKGNPLVFLINEDVLLVFLCLNCANDFVIYILSSKQFRQLFIKKIVCCWKQQPSNGRSISQIEVRDTSSSDNMTGTSVSDISECK